MDDCQGWKTLLPCRRCPKEKRKELPVNHVGLFSFLTLSWLDRLMWRSFRNGLQHEEIWTSPSTSGAQFNAERLKKLWEDELASRGPEAKLSRVLLRYASSRVIAGSIVVVLSNVGLLSMAAFFMNRVLRATWSPEGEIWEVILLILGLFFFNLLVTMLFVAGFSTSQVAGGYLRNGALGLLYHKLLDGHSVPEKTAAKVLNVFATDGQRLYDGVSFLPMLLGGPVLIFGAMGISVFLLGPWTLLGFFITLLLFPLQGMAGKVFMNFRADAIAITDKRVRKMTEYISNMKFIKMYTWEIPLTNIISGLRDVERKVLEKVNIALSMAFIIGALVVSTATMITLIAYVVHGNELNGVIAFTYIILYSSIQDKMELTSMSIRYLSDFFVAADRIQEALMMETKESSLTVMTQRSDHVVRVSDASFMWPQVQSIFPTKPDNSSQGKSNRRKKNKKNKDLHANKNAPETEVLTTPETPLQPVVLKGISMKVEKGEVIGLVGPVGSGKSALMTAILGQMDKVKGEVEVDGTLAYVPQQPWIFNSTLRDNILLGLPLDQDKYDRVIEACCLKPDLQILPAGDLTEIGERGINLSGGQKQRISMARAVYADRQIYLLDDPLASVDPDVAENIHQKVIQGCLMGKTIFFITNKIKFLQECDKVVYLSGGKIVEMGTPEYLADSQGLFASLVEQKDQQTAVADRTSELSTIDPSLSNGDLNDDVFQDHDEKGLSAQNDTRRSSHPEGASLIAEEDAAHGAVSWHAYATYIKAGGGPGALLVIVLLALLAEGAKAFSYWWLAVWIRANKASLPNVTFPMLPFDDQTTASTSAGYTVGEEDEEEDLWVYHLVYGMSLLGIVLLFLLRSVVLAKLLMKSSSNLHNALFKKIIYCPMSFFDTTPLGRIVNRFSRDMDELDARLPPMIDSTIRTLISLVLYLILIAIIIPWFLVSIPFLFILFLFLYSIFRVGIREIRRMQLGSMAPLLSHINASLEGLRSIKAYNKEADFYSKFTTLLDCNTVWQDLFQYTLRWINIKLGIVMSCILALTSLLVILLRDSIPVEYAGTAIIYAIQLLSLAQLFVRFAIETEAVFISVERIRSYLKVLPAESVNPVEKFPLPDDWPSRGKIDFENYQSRYRPGLPLVLQDVTITISPKEKIGIVGRTGSGKSSLVNALFRLVEPTGGCLRIDEIDTSQLRLPDLRSQVSIIPQDPVMFSGTLRYNLDPMKRHIDMEIWRELEKCHIKDMVANLDNKLDTDVVERGENFSVGERQLLCMARVLLQRSKILVLDEATAAIDNETSEKINQALMTEFTDTTLLIIAHRLETVQQCDKILVMDMGRVVEFDTPESLLNNKESYFYRMMTISRISREVKVPDDNAWV